MYDQRNRFAAYFLLTVFSLFVGWWLYAFLSDALLYWGLGGAPSRLFGAIGAACLLAAILVRPIPAKVRTIAAIYVFLFSLLFFALQRAFALLWPAASDIGWLWQGGVAAFAASFAMLVYGFMHGKKLVLTRYVVETNLPVAGGELKIALISDVHMGLTIDEDRLSRQMERLASEQPDLLVVAGDLVDDRTSPEQMRAACSIVGGVPATYGVVFVYGNHDLASHGPTPPYTKAELDRALSGAGIRVLDDRVATLAGLTLLGRRDAGFSHTPSRASLKTLLEGADRSMPVILIDHQPRERKEAAALGVTLQLAGHTHGGQIWPMSWLSRLSGAAYGHKRTQNTHLIVSSGMGNRGSVLRSGSTAEMVLIRLRSRVN